MLIQAADGVQQAVSGSGLVLGAVAVGMQSFAAAGYEAEGAGFVYRLWSGEGEWEVGLGRMAAGGEAIERVDFVSSSSGGALVPGESGWQIAVVASAGASLVAQGKPAAGGEEGSGVRNVPPIVGPGGIAAGDGALASALAVALGPDTEAADSAVAVGAGAEAYDERGVAMGARAIASVSAVAAGAGAEALAGSVAMGAGAWAASRGVALGAGARADWGVVTHSGFLAELPDYMPGYRPDDPVGAFTQGVLWAGGARSAGDGGGDPIELDLAGPNGQSLRLPPDTVLAGVLTLVAARLDGAIYAARHDVVAHRAWATDTIVIVYFGAPEVIYATPGVSVSVAAVAGEFQDGAGDWLRLRATVPDDEVWCLGGQIVGPTTLLMAATVD